MAAYRPWRRDKNASPPCQIRRFQRNPRPNCGERVVMAKAQKAAKPRSTSTPVPVSPLAPKSFPSLPPLAGVRLATGEAGVRYAGRTDVLLAIFASGTQV